LDPADLFTLLDEAGFAPTPLEVAEVLWLAQFARPPADQGAGHDSPATGASEPQTGRSGSRDVRPSAAPRTAAAGAHARPRLPLYLPGPEAAPGTAAIQSGQSAGTVRVPAATAMPAGQALLNALRPLRQTAPDRTHLVLDEEATADVAAQSGMVVPVLRDGNERGLSLTFVVLVFPSFAVSERSGWRM